MGFDKAKTVEKNIFLHNLYCFLMHAHWMTVAENYSIISAKKANEKNQKKNCDHPVLEQTLSAFCFQTLSA